MEAIRFEHITKIFGSVIANNDISFGINKGEVLSILGENGSGKTTLLNVLDGIYQQDSGKILIDGQEVTIKSPKDAYTHKIGMVHQHYKLVEAFTAIENVILGLSNADLKKILLESNQDIKLSKFKRITLKESAFLVSKMCQKYGFKFEPYKYIYDMSIAEKQTLEIIKCLFRGVDFLILDEPTAVLTPQETQHLFDVIRNMKKDGKTIIIITHKLNEVLEISDRVVVLRKGEYIDDIATNEATEAKLVEMMVGKKVDLDIHRSEIEHLGVRLAVKDLSVLNREGELAVKDATFDLYGGEILGIAGISGSGQRELLEAIGGLAKEVKGDVTFYNPKKDKPITLFHKTIPQIKKLAKEGKLYFASGEVCRLDSFNNKKIEKMVHDEQILFYEDEIINLLNKKPIEIRNLGIKLSFVPEDRLGMGLVGDMDIIDNVLLRSYRKGKGRLLKKDKSKKLAEQIVKELDVQTPSLETPISKLSGGNIQKVLVGREISSSPKILMVAYPVRGLDINSSYQIYHLLDEQKKKGTAIIYVGEDLDVLLAISDRVLVMADGVITGIKDSKNTTKEEIGVLMTKQEREENHKW